MNVDQLCFGFSDQRRPAHIKEMEAAARKLQSMYRWRKLWRQLDTSQERAEATAKIQSMQQNQQVRRGLAAQFAAFEEETAAEHSDDAADSLAAEAGQIGDELQGLDQGNPSMGLSVETIQHRHGP